MNWEFILMNLESFLNNPYNFHPLNCSRNLWDQWLIKSFCYSTQPNTALFEACCNEKIQQFDDSGSDEEVRPFL